MLNKLWKRISDKKAAGKKLIPLVLGLSAAMWIGAGTTWFILKDKALGASAKQADGHGDAHGLTRGEGHGGGNGEGHAEAQAEGHGISAPSEAEPENDHAELEGVPATAHAAGHGEEASHGHENAAGSAEGREEAVGEESKAGAEARAEAGENGEAHGGEALANGSETHTGSVPTREEMAALRQVAEMRVAAGELVEAVEPMRRVMSMPTQDATLLSLAARVFLGTGNYAEAFRYATQLAKLAPDDMAARVQSVEAQYRLGQVEQAMHAAEAALKVHPGDLAMLVALGTMQVEMGPGGEHYGKALAEALKLKPDYAPALYLLGRKAQLEGDFKDAETAFAKVLKLDPENAKAMGQLGMAQYHLGKGVAAEKSFRSELSRNPADYNTWYNLGELLLGRANEETSSEAVRRFRGEALECYLKSIELNPEHAQARYRVGVLMIGNGQYKEAIRHLEAALRLDARHVPTLVQLALAYEYLKQPERARAYLNRAFELDPLNKVVLSKLRGLS